MCMPCDVRQRASARALILVCNLQGIRWMGAKIALKINVEINTANEWWHVWVILFDIMSRGASNRKHNRKTTHFLRVLGYLRAGFFFFFSFGLLLLLMARVFRMPVEHVRFVWNWRYSRFCIWKRVKNCCVAVDCCDAAATVLLAHFSIEYYFSSFNS